MPEISKIRLPSGSVYDIKDAVAREAIAGGVTFIVAWDGTTTPDVTGIPAGVKVTYNNTVYTGTLSAETTGSGTHAQAGAFYLVRTSTAEYVLLTAVPSDWSTKYTDYYTYNSSTGVYSKVTGASAPTWAADTYYKAVFDIYDEYVPVGTTGSKYWEKIGDTQVDMSNVVTGVTLNKQNDNVLGESTTFALTSGTVTVTPSTTKIKATASGTAVGTTSGDALTGLGTPTTDTFVKSVSAETNKKLVVTSITPTNGTESVSKVTKTASKLVTTSIPNVTGNTDVSIPNVTGNATVTANKSTWSFTMGSGNDSETLIIGGGNGSDVEASKVTLGTALSASKVTLGTAITAATGGVASDGAGSDIVTAVTVSDKTVAKAGSAVTVATGATATDGTGDAIVTGVTIGSSAAAITAITPTIDTFLKTASISTQPSVTISSGTTGDVTVATGISSASVGTAITVGTNDKVNALTNSTSITVTKGSNS